MFPVQKKQIVFSLNSQINSTLSNKVPNPFNIEIPNGNWRECIIEEGFVVVRIPQGYQLPQLPTSFQLISFSGTGDYLGDNLTSTSNAGVFLIDQRTDIPLAGNNDLYSYSFKLLNSVVLTNVSSNISFCLVGRVINATFPTTNELFINKQYNNGLYFVNFDWNATNTYFAIYLKLKLIN